MTESATSKTTEMETELKAMRKIQAIVQDLTPAQMRRVGPWVANVAKEMADAKDPVPATA